MSKSNTREEIAAIIQDILNLSQRLDNLYTGLGYEEHFEKLMSPAYVFGLDYKDYFKACGKDNIAIENLYKMVPGIESDLTHVLTNDNIEPELKEVCKKMLFERKKKLFMTKK